ncbi:hypothetical protein MOQ72_32230 [Saccharopolyspora sp. K220]|uniref:hypothetical protein n=1 Tax=Saccharopolyspora soli TaxID=2926618 RepID=UPI001F562B52|nr:hypothetical protein [Saccharopolyspora soli]MCI2422109.1 hypothetical protein [Saccharopolyspora soli]
MFSGLVAYRGIVPGDRVADTPLVSAKWWGGDRHLVHYWVSCEVRRPRTSAVQGGSRANDFLRGTSSGLSSEDVYGYDAWQVPILT